MGRRAKIYQLIQQDGEMTVTATQLGHMLRMAVVELGARVIDEEDQAYQVEMDLETRTLRLTKAG